MKTGYQQKNEQVLTSLEILKNDIQNISMEEIINFLSLVSQFHNYSFNNILLIHGQCPNASQVASFKKWKEMNRFVKKGEKAIKILAPRIYKTTTKVESSQNSKEEVNEVHNQVGGFFPVPVFDISQTKGEEIKKDMTVSSNTSFKDVQAFVNNLDDKLSITFEPLKISLGGYYVGAKNLIALNSNLNKIENTGTLLHELSHHLLGHSQDDNSPRTEKEQEAETLTHLFCKHFGIERKSKLYLKSWGGISENLEKIVGVYKESIGEYQKG